MASVRGHVHVVKLLLDCGADPRLRDCIGCNPMLEAAKVGGAAFDACVHAGHPTLRVQVTPP